MKEQLLAIDFDDKEADIYTALLKLDNASVSELLKNTSIERRTIYDVLERLIQKGRASYFEENNTRKYKAISPEIILEELKHKQKEFEAIIPKLQSLQETPSGAKVEILKGLKGLKAIFIEAIQAEQTHYSFGDLSPLMYEEKYAKEVAKFLKEIDKKGMKVKILYGKGDPIKKIKGGEYRTVNKEDIAPSPTLICGDVVTQYIYTDPITIIKITSKEVSETYKQYFNHFWKLAKRDKK